MAARSETDRLPNRASPTRPAAVRTCRSVRKPVRFDANLLLVAEHVFRTLGVGVALVALVGLVRVSTHKQDTQRQHDALGPLCVKVFEERASGKLAVADRPELRAALEYMRPGDMLTVHEADRLGRNLLEGLVVLNDLFQRGIAVKILDGIAAGEHVERSLILDLALALAEDRRRDIVRKTKSGLEAARRQGRVGGRPRVVDENMRHVILARRAEGQSLRQIARAVGVSLAVVHGEVTAALDGKNEPGPDDS